MNNPRYRRITPNKPIAQHAQRSAYRLPYAIAGVLLGCIVGLVLLGLCRIWFNF